MNINVKNRFRHFCDLPRETLILAAQSSAYSSKWKDLFEKWTTVADGEETRLYFRSGCEIRKERRRHRKKFPKTLHPFSAVARLQAMVITPLWLMVMLADSYCGAFMWRLLYSRTMYASEGFLYVANWLFVMDVALRLGTGYAIERTRTVILDRRLAMMYYLKTFFFFDALPCCGYLLFYHGEAFPDLLQIGLFHLVNLRFVRIKTMVDSVDKSLLSMRVRDAGRKIIILVMMGVVIVHLLTCASGFHVVVHEKFEIALSPKSWYFKAIDDREKRGRSNTSEPYFLYVFSMYSLHATMVCCHFFGLHYSRYRTDEEFEMLFFTFVLLLGMSYYIYCVARILQLVGILNLSEEKYDELLVNADDYMRKKAFPLELKQRIRLYYDYKFNKKYFDEEAILATLSEHLQMEVLLYSCKNLINRVHVFKGLSKAAVGCLLSLMQQEIFVPNDLILRVGEDTTSLYFILYGTCGIKLDSGKEVMHIEDGDHFGNLVGFTYEVDTKVAYALVALEMVHIYRLDRNDVLYCLKNHPEIQAKLEAMEKNRLRQYNTLFRLRGEDDDVTEDIINELRRGKILRKGIRRSHLLLTPF